MPTSKPSPFGRSFKETNSPTMRFEGTLKLNGKDETHVFVAVQQPDYTYRLAIKPTDGDWETVVPVANKTGKRLEATPYKGAFTINKVKLHLWYNHVRTPKYDGYCIDINDRPSSAVQNPAFNDCPI